MNMTFLLRFYKYYISPLNPPSCRFYPTCSEYAMLCFRFQHPLVALYHTIARILRCNQLFKGGFDYPMTKINPQQALQKVIGGVLKRKMSGEKIDIDFWLFPSANTNKYYIIQHIKANKALESQTLKCQNARFCDLQSNYSQEGKL